MTVSIKILALISLICLAAGCQQQDNSSTAIEKSNQNMEIIAKSNSGPIIIVFTSEPIANNAPPDGVRKAVKTIAHETPCAAAAFLWSEKKLATKWLKNEIEQRESKQEIIQIILAGYSLGGTSAAEMTKLILKKYPLVNIELLITVDALKTGIIGSAVGITGSVITMANPIGKNVVFTSYESAPIPDQKQFKKHINYYQTNGILYHGTAMPYAINQKLNTGNKIINHASSDDIARPFIIADLRKALMK